MFSKINNKAIQGQAQSIFRKYPVLFAYLFGSYTKQRIRDKSDIDIALFFGRKIQEKQRDILRRQIQEELAHALKKYDQVDVISLNDAYSLLEKEVIYNGQLIYCKDEAAQAHYQARAISRWLDYKWHYDKWAKRILER